LYVQRHANAMASVSPMPVKCHEPTAMAVARSVSPVQYCTISTNKDQLFIFLGAGNLPEIAA
jgi:hypothetical protein